jgi:phosphopantothenoylcysteine decarboxylase/phosphopantothenate--cysteine ligase
MVKARKKHVLVTAGPTREHLDPVRFLSNPSTGKMGYAVAEAALHTGCSVDLVSGPVGLSAPAGAVLHEVVSAAEMLLAAERLFDSCDCLIAVAAVSDWRPAYPSGHKVKKGAGAQTLDLVPNQDILATLAARKREGQVVVGFCAETEDLETNARAKLAAKNLDWIAGNLVGGTARGFQSDQNELLVLDSSGQRAILGPGAKSELAAALVRLIGLRS